jgi:hypothetical protein
MVQKGFACFLLMHVLIFSQEEAQAQGLAIQALQLYQLHH